MAIQVQHRRGTAAAHAGFVGAPGEITATTDTKRLILHDGATVGGIPVARLDEVSSEVMRPVGNANFSFLTTDRLVVPTTAYTAPRTGTLPAANAVSAGRTITFFDTLPAINGANTLTIARAGTDTINGATSLVCSAPGGRWDMVSDGVSRWSVTASFTDGDRGDATVSGGGSSITVKNKAITLAKQADVDSGVIMGRDSLLAGSQESLTPARARAVIGEATLAAVEAYPDHDRLIALMLGRRLAFLQALRTWSTFGRGWSGRVAQVKQIGQAWATGSVGPDPVFAAGGNAKATIDQAKPLPVKAAADATTGAGIGSGGLAGLLEQARQQLDPLAASSQLIGNVVAALVITGVVLTAGGFFYRWLAARRGKALADALDLPEGVTA